MDKLQESLLQLDISSDITARQFNILRSPKKNGTACADSIKYLSELGINIVDNCQPIQFLPNTNEPVHRWSPYVQGFSAKFVQRILDRYRGEYESPFVLDPFAGSGTVIVQAKFNGFESYGVELNPLLHFVAETKINSWLTNPDDLLNITRNLSKKCLFEAPDFLKSDKQFNLQVLHNLEKIKSGIDSFEPVSVQDRHIKDLMLLAFAAILIDCSNLKRTPCLGYSKTKVVEDNAPFDLFAKKVEEIAKDLWLLQNRYKRFIRTQAKMMLANSMSYTHTTNYDLAITSPPYMNGLDYVINYKIEMGWLGFAQNHRELKKVKDEMVVCDNVSKGLVRDFASRDCRYTNDWIEGIKADIAENITRRGTYRRVDMPEIVHKYFDDMYRVMQKVTLALNSGGRFILVVGDSLIADVYLPTDLILARMGKEMGYAIERIEKARDRRSGQIRTYKLRETIITLRKEK
jgi:DNA modification methylase